MKIGFAGNGHLMQYSAMAAHAKGFERITYTPVKTGDCVEDLHECDIVYICPDRPSNTSPQQMMDLVYPHLRDDAILIILCQVTPGFTRTIRWPASQLYYQIETLRMKDAEQRALHPDRIILGTCWPRKDGIDCPKLMSYLSAFECPIITMSYESAELAKIAINVYLASQVATTNTLSEVAEVVGADWDEIIPALSSDARIGAEAYLQPGYGLSQHLERDLKTLQQYAANTKVTDAFLEHSEYRRHQKT